MNEFGLAVWSHRIEEFGEEEQVKERAAALADAGFDLVIPCVKNAPGAVDFFTDVADVNPEYPKWDPLKVLIDACGQHGVKVHPWFCVFREEDQSRLLESTQFMDSNECQTMIAAARNSCGMTTEQMLRSIDAACEKFAENKRAKYSK